MKNFIEWLENSHQIQFQSFLSDGRVNVNINGNKYTFITDSAYHPKWIKMHRFSPWKVMNQIKDLVNKGHARQLNSHRQEKSEETVDGCPNCKTPSPHYIDGIECPGCGLNTQ